MLDSSLLQPPDDLEDDGLDGGRDEGISWGRLLFVSLDDLDCEPLEVLCPSLFLLCLLLLSDLSSLSSEDSSSLSSFDASLVHL